MTEYGVDVSTFPALDLSGTNISGPRCVIEVAVRRLSTDPEVIEYATAEECLDLRHYLSKALGPGDLGDLENRIEGVVERDERVKKVTAQVRQLSESITVVLRVQPFEGRAFRLAIEATRNAVNILNA